MARFVCMFGWGSALLALGLAPCAHAGETGSSSDGSSSEGTTVATTETGTSDTGTTDTGTTDTGTTDTGSSTGPCEPCDANPGDTMIVTPPPSSTVDSPFQVDVTVVQRVACDCTETPPMYVQLFLDTVAVGAPCYELECSWEVDTTIGPHTLFASATYGPDDWVGTTINVSVQSAATGTDTGADTSGTAGATGTESSTGTPPMNEEPSGGCGCAADPASARAAWLVPLALLVRRRRRR